jgi:acetyl-CoA carboxylase biotin carboxyl carrier protein
MPENPTGPSEPFDVHNIRHLVRLMKRYDLTAIDLIEGQTKIRLRRRGPEVAVSGSTPTPMHHAVPTVPQAAAAPPLNVVSTPTAASHDSVIESPMVGTYYASPSPDSQPFVTVGSNIRPDTTVCVIEAMKVFTDIPAGLSGTITEVLVKNGQPVEFGQALFRVRSA